METKSAAVKTGRKKEPPIGVISASELMQAPQPASDSKPVELIGIKETSRHGLVKKLRAGLDVLTVEKLRTQLAVSQSELNRLIEISPRTLSRRKKEGKLHTDESERIYKYAVLLVRAEEVLGNHDDALHWLKSPQRALGGQTPLDYADTEVGANEVKDLLGRIEHGIFS